MIEKELFREQLWLYLLKKVKEQLTNAGAHWTDKEINHLVLRYMFIKLACTDPKNESDPIFITNKCALAEEQLLRDLEFRRDNFSPNAQSLAAQLIQFIEDRFEKSKTKMLQTKFHPDDKLQFSTIIKDSVKYKQRVINGVTTISPEKTALKLRLIYLGLDNQGLARRYKEEMKVPQNARVVECFDSGESHYFDEYCCPFPDLVPDSLGSFYNLNLARFPHHQFVVNFPFDETLILLGVDKILHWLHHGDPKITKFQSFILTMPSHWKKFAALDKLMQSEFLKNRVNFSKGQLAFHNYLTGETIYPCPIAEIHLSSRSFPTGNFVTRLIQTRNPGFDQLAQKIVGTKWDGLINRQLPLDWTKPSTSDCNQEEYCWRQICNWHKCNTASDATASALIQLKRASKRTSELKNLLGRIQTRNNAMRTYLDYSTGDGVIARHIGNEFKWETYGTDLPNWHTQVRTESSSFKFLIPHVTDTGEKHHRIPFEDKQFDLITCFMVLHHIPSYSVYWVINDLWSRLNYGGLLIVREHDVVDEATNDLCHAEHALFSLVHEKQEMDDFVGEYYGLYRPLQQWCDIFESSGLFNVLYVDDFKVSAISMYNPTRYGHIVLEKISQHQQ